MPDETQRLTKSDGSTVTVSRNGNHHYRVNGGPPLPSVTSLIGHIDGDSFGAAMGWTRKMIDQSGGDIDAALKAGKEARDLGTSFHASVETFLKNYLLTSVLPEGPLFDHWRERFARWDDKKERWVLTNAFFGSEWFVANESQGYGGTIDALSLEPIDGRDGVVIWDWKTKSNIESYEKYGPPKKDVAQLSAYAKAFTSMDLRLGPVLEGYIGYVMADRIDIVPCDLEEGWELFQLSHRMHTLVKRGK